MSEWIVTVQVYEYETGKVTTTEPSRHVMSDAVVIAMVTASDARFVIEGKEVYMRGPVIVDFDKRTLVLRGEC